MSTKSTYIVAIATCAWSCLSAAHDLIGIDGERERKVKALEIITAKSAATGLPATMMTGAQRTTAAIVVPRPRQFDAAQLKQFDKIINRNQGIVVAKDLSQAPSLPGLPAGTPQFTSTLDSVISVAKTWDPGSTLKICFYDGDSIARAFVKAYAIEWTHYGNIAFDFGATPTFRTCAVGDKSVIRITFAGGGYASYVGLDSIFYANQNLPTMFLQSLDHVNLQQDDYRSVIIHEFGHALGFEHEHQSPMSVCENQFDFQAIKQKLGWDDAKVKFNFEQIRVSKLTQKGKYFVGVASDGTPISASQYDDKSVMHYSLPASYFKTPPGTCYIALNAQLSGQDQKAMADTYPYVTAAAFNAKHNANIEQLLKAPQITDVSRAALKALKRL